MQKQDNDEFYFMTGFFFILLIGFMFGLFLLSVFLNSEIKQNKKLGVNHTLWAAGICPLLSNQTGSPFYWVGDGNV